MPAYVVYSYMGNKILTVARSTVGVSPTLFWLLTGGSLLAFIPIIFKFFYRRN
jgi:uncharacterized membrane protein